MCKRAICDSAAEALALITNCLTLHGGEALPALSTICVALVSGDGLGRKYLIGRLIRWWLSLDYVGFELSNIPPGPDYAPFTKPRELTQPGITKMRQYGKETAIFDRYT